MQEAASDGVGRGNLAGMADPHDLPWQDDAGSLVDAFRAGERSPKEELQATLDAIEASDLNCFAYLDPERALAGAESADLSLPFGGVPVGIKELDQVTGWPDTGASLVFKDRVATTPRPRAAPGRATAAPCRSEPRPPASSAGSTSASPSINGVTHNPWQLGRTAGWLVRRQRGGRLRRAGEPRHRRRRRWIHPHPRRLQRTARHEGHLRPHVAGVRTPTAAPAPSCSASSPARCATPPATSTCAPASTRGTRRTLAPARRLGGGPRLPRAGRQAGGRHPATWPASPSRPASRTTSAAGRRS